MTGTAMTLSLRLFALLGLLGISITAGALDLDRTFGVYGYVPVSAAETQSDTAAGVVKQTDEKLIVLGTRRVAGRGVLLLQRYSPDGTMDAFFGEFGTATIDVAGVSLTAKQLFLQSDGKYLAVAETASEVRIYSILPSGQPDTSFGAAGELQIPFAAGALPGTTSVHLLETGKLLVVSQNPPGASGSLSVSRYLTEGVIDNGFGLRGTEVISNLGAGVGYAGVAAVLLDGRIVVVLAGSDGATRGLLMLDRNGQLDTTVNGGKPVFPAPLQGRTITKLVPLFSGYFLAIGVSGAGGAQTTTVTRFDPKLVIDSLFGTNGTLTVQSADAGGSIALTEGYETPDNTVILTGSSNNGLIVARYVASGQPDMSFNAGKGVLVVPEPGSRATVGVASLQYPSGQIVHVGYGVLYGAGGTNVSRAFLINTVDGVPDVGFGSEGVINLFGAQPPTAEHAQIVTPLADGKVLVLSATGFGDGLLGVLSRYLPDGRLDPSFGTAGRSTFVQNGKCEWPMSMTLQPDGKVLILGTSFNMIDCGTSAMFGKRFGANGVEENFQLFYSGTAQRARSGAVALQGDGKIVVTGQDDRSLVVARFLANGFADPGFGTGGRLLWPTNNVSNDAKGGALLVRPDQRVVVAGSLDGVQIVLMQLNADGSLDSSFGIGGTAVAPVPASFLEVHALASTTAGKLLVLARSGQRALLAQFEGNGAVDRSFGNNGQLLLPLFIGGGGQYSKFGMLVQNDGGIIVSGQTPVDPASEVEVIRLTENGQNDAAFGTNGIWRWRPSVFYAAGATGIAAAPNGSLYVIGFGIPGGFLARLGTGITTTQVVEFYNATLNHYFITADPAEQAAIDGGSAGPGWSRTGKSFKAYTTTLGVPAGQSPVCRFYGSTAIDPATGSRRGPNSHFYTVEAAECAAVQRDPGWTFEGIAFHTRGRDVDGICPVGLVAVLRTYNNRALFNDSNHRYTTDFATYQLMQSLGWNAEGVVFCTAP